MGILEKSTQPLAENNVRNGHRIHPTYQTQISRITVFLTVAVQQRRTTVAIRIRPIQKESGAIQWIQLWSKKHVMFQSVVSRILLLEVFSFIRNILTENNRRAE